VKTSVAWNYKAPEGTGDTYQSILRGSKANLLIRQGVKESWKPVLYIEPVVPGPDYENMLAGQFSQLQAKYPGISLKSSGKGWQVVIPDKYQEDHEAHFGRVMQQFLQYLSAKKIPDWEEAAMLAKYYTTTTALQMALDNN
jgi:Putative oxidoreductase C terminal domain